MTHVSNAAHDTHERVEIDQSKLLGFRNLIPVAKDDLDIAESSELAFNKKGDPEPTTPR